MKCPVTTCYRNCEPGCGIIEITKKEPSDKYHCSYYCDAKTTKKRFENIIKEKTKNDDT